MKQRKVAVVCARGLGDALLSMILSHNLTRSRIDVTTFSSILCELEEWFPGQTILPYPEDQSYAFFDQVIATDHVGLQEVDPRMIILKEAEFDKRQTMVDNLQRICKDHFKLDQVNQETGIVPPKNLKWRAHKKRIVIHPTSSDPKKNWPKTKFFELAERLKKEGFEPVFCVSPQERKEWKMAPNLPTVSDLSRFVYESGYMIGNDSGVGHLASLFRIPTLSFFARKSYSHLWRPGWGPGHVVSPPSLLPGSKLKQLYWKKLLSVNRAIGKFSKLTGEER